jgi:multicomponent Na+:H+ antiporter subunit D
VNVLIPLPIALPLLGAAISLALHGRLRAQRVVGLVATTAALAVAVALLVRVEDRGIAVSRIGGWPAAIGITLVADLLAVLMLVTSLTMVVAVLVYAVASPKPVDRSAHFHPVYLVLVAGVSASLLTGDLFNLFVAFEVMLIASYVLITLGGRPNQVRMGMTYVVISLLASTLFVTAVAFVYAATGTVDLADLSGRMADLPPGVRDALGLLLLVVFGVKAAIFPLFFWLPDSYPTAATPITAIFAGLLTKVGVYAIIRSQTLLFPADSPSTVMLVLAALTMVIGVLGAIAQNDIKRLLSFHIVSQIGYMIFGLALFTVAGIAGAIFYVINQIVVKTSLFLVGGLVENSTGTGSLKRLGGMAHQAPLVGAFFLLPALSLAGIPPFSGFVAKLAVVEAGLAAESYVLVGVALFVSLLTLFSMVKIWIAVFWGTPADHPPGTPLTAASLRRTPAPMLLATGGAVAMGLFFTVAAGPIYDLCQRAAVDLVDPARYVEAVFGR